jgi:hypothetical protein
MPGVVQVYFLNEGVAQIVNNPLNHKLKVCCRSFLESYLLPFVIQTCIR